MRLLILRRHACMEISAWLLEYKEALLSRSVLVLASTRVRLRDEARRTKACKDLG